MDSQALVSVFPQHRGRLVAVLSRLVGTDEAEDLANETLLKAMDAVEGFREESALGTWLHRIATNLAYDHLRRQGRQPIEYVDTDELPEAAEEGADLLEQRQMSECVTQVLAALPVAQRQILVQADVLERTTAEIAKDAGITTGNAKIRLHRARRALQAELNAQCDFHHREAGVLCCTPKQEV